MSLGRQTIQFSVSDSTKREFEEGARRLHLSPAAYFAYRVERTKPGTNVARLDRHVREVFGKHGELMRRLAK
jgi:hypothetical protein